MTGRVAQVAIVSPSCAFVRGYGTRELIVELRGRAPLFASSVRSWVMQAQSARDLIAVAESRGWRVEIVDEAHLRALAGREQADERGLLW